MKKIAFVVSLITTLSFSVFADVAKAYDIVIYGGSPAAVSAAVQAKRMGKSAVIVLPDVRIGGLTTGGLGQTDIGNKHAFGGISLEFYRGIAQWYRDDKNWTRQKREDYLPDGQCTGTQGEDSMWTFEPSVALAVIEGWIRRDAIEVVRGEKLDRAPGGVVVKDGRILSFKTLSGRVFKGKMFVDATYEGDLMAAAGVTYIVGRESNAKYGETLSGCQRAYATHHQFVKGVSAYVKEGDPSSGLLPGVTMDDGRPDGTGDKFVQAYCFRMCLTDDPENRIPFKKPSSYNEQMYELLFRQLAARGEEYYESKNEWRLPWINSKMPNRKTDTNNRDGFSSDFIGMNWAWPEASYEEREKIFKAHLDYQRGLMWTLANHPRVPQAVRREYSRWGTCRDEFTDGPGDGWQSQLYVREARRMVGEYVMTEANCRGKRTVRRPVAMGAYTMDSHHVRRLADKNGHVFNEGDVEVGRNDDGMRMAPYQIEYGAIIPKRSECKNIFVPVCLSASHIAFGSIRMEPVFFALGQVAGTAAAQAIDADCSVQDLPYTPLQVRLVADGQVLMIEPPTEVVVAASNARDFEKRAAAYMSAAAAQTDPLQTIMLVPLGLTPDETPVVERIEKLHELSGVSIFALHGPGHLVRLDGAKKVDDYRGYGEKIARIRARLAKKGIECGYLIHPSINMGIRHPGCDYLQFDGSVRSFTGCSYDPDFRAAFVSNITALAAAGKPPFIMIEDDFRYFRKGCFCKRHLEGFSKMTGRAWTRESLSAAIDADRKLKSRWHDWQMSSLISLASELSASVEKVNPGCRFGTCAPGGVREKDTLKVANAAAGKNRAFIRWYGTNYGSDNPQEVFRFLVSAQYARENMDDGHEYFYEADTVPHTVLFASAARTVALMSLTYAMGFDRMWFWGAGSGPLDIEMCPDYMRAYRENIKPFVEIRRMGKMGRPAGLQVGAGFGWYPVLNRLGYPVVTCESRVRFFDGVEAFAEMDDDAVRKALSGRAFLDGEAAEAAVKRGFGDLIGLNLNGKERGITFSGECSAKGIEPERTYTCSFHANYGLDGSRVCDFVLDGAEELTYFFNGRPEKRDRPAIVRIKNRLGGRVVTMAVAVRGLTSPNVFNYLKRNLIHEQLKWLGGESVVPAHVFNAPKVYLLARESEKTLFLHGVNLSCDPVRDIVFDLAPEWLGAGVETLGADGVWRKADYAYENGRLRVKTGGVQVFGYFDFRLTK